MGASSSVVSNTSEKQQFQGVLPSSSTSRKIQNPSNNTNNHKESFSSSRSQRKRFVQNSSFFRNITHNIDDTLAHSVEQAAQLGKNTPATSIASITKDSDDSSCKVESFMDSVYISNWLAKDEADNLFACLAQIGEKNRPKDMTLANLQRSKYPLWTKYYGLKRRKDGARALDRWGSYHESWVRVEEPPSLLVDIAAKLRSHFHLSEDAVNSMVVNYYYDGDNTYIPAHRDTVACLEEDSHVICLSLGASRDFVLCANEDAGKFDKEDMTIVKEWRVKHGDVFAIGQKTNQAYCHAVTREIDLSDMRISVIFRSIDKSFISYDCEEKMAIYKSGKKKPFCAECISTVSYEDEGKREHIADLINRREETKQRKADEELRRQQAEEEQHKQDMQREQQLLSETEKDQSEFRKRFEEELYAQNLKKELYEVGEDILPPASSAVLASYYMGQGVAVPSSNSCHP